MPVQIITPNVIRQALKFMGAPKPLHFKECSPILCSEANTSMQQVWIEFYTFDMYRWLEETGHDTLRPRAMAIGAALQECFCSDVQIMGVQFADHAGYVRVSCLLIVDNDPVQ